MEMTNHQRDCLDWFEQNRLNTTRFDGRWIWREDIRRDTELADRFWQKIDRETRVVAS